MPATKSVYLRDEEIPIWERAKELSQDKLSPVIVQALQNYIADVESAPAGFERIVVAFDDADDDGIPKRKAFYGRWLTSKPLEFDHADGAKYHEVALTAKGQYVFLSHFFHHEFGESNKEFRVHPSLRAAAEDENVALAARHIMRRTGVPIEELDI